MLTKTKKEENTNFYKSIFINNMFNSIAYKYDLLNNIMTFGLHYKWKESLIKLALKETNSPQLTLDICTGTGDLAFILNNLSPKTNIIGIDNSKNMIDIANHKKEKNKINNISFLADDIEKVKFNESTFDIITIGFGLRNLVNKEKSIENIYNILKKDGVLACIDLGYPENILWKKIYNIYLFYTVPLLGLLFAKNINAYSYLANSIKSWYNQEELKKLILKKGYSKCYFKNILDGVVAIHIAVK